MLRELVIEDFAIITKLDLTFHEGMTVLTGETGAGKSIIIDAVGLLVGSRGSSDFIRYGKEKCRLAGVFDLPTNPDAMIFKLLSEFDIALEDNSLLIQRDIFKNGKNTCRINGSLVNITTLKQIGAGIVDIHGQNEHQKLMNPEAHLEILDEFGGQKILQEKQKYQGLHEKYQKLDYEFRHFQQNEKAWMQRLDMLRFQTAEIADSDLIVGEEEQLLAEKTKWDNYQRIMQVLSQAYDALQEESYGALTTVGNTMNEMSSIEELSEDYQSISETVKNAFYSLDEAAADISKQMDLLEWDEERYQFVLNRLEEIHQMERKYGNDIATILHYFEEISEELASMEATEASANDLEERATHAEEKLREQGQKLTKIRKTVAKNLTEKLKIELNALYMEKAIFEVRFLSDDEPEHFYGDGCDRVEFYIAPNIGEPLKPLAKIASGGELSRMMLAMKTIFSKSQGLTSIIFDEVDTGVSGRVAQAIADKIYAISKNSQVLCITHLPQVAATADEHLFIRKKIVGKRTETEVDVLDRKARIIEIARMLSGAEMTDLTKQHAEELLEMAHENK